MGENCDQTIHMHTPFPAHHPARQAALADAVPFIDPAEDDHSIVDTISLIESDEPEIIAETTEREIDEHLIVDSLREEEEEPLVGAVVAQTYPERLLAGM